MDAAWARLALAVVLFALPSAVSAQSRPNAPNAPNAQSRPNARDADPLREARRLITRGEYAPAELRLRALLSTVPGAHTTLARLLFDTGRYAEAAERAELGAREPSQRIASTTIQAEALAARGLLDEAERTFRSVAGEPLAFRARARLGSLLLDRGRRDEARPWLESLLEAHRRGETKRARELAEVALAARRLGQFALANDTFREAALRDRKRAETQLEWALMFLDKHDFKHAGQSVLEALEHNRNHPVAHTLMARLTLQQSLDFDEADSALARAFAVNPNLVLAHATRATMALRDMELAAADAALDRALAIDPRDLEALSLRAAVRFLADDAAGFAKAKRAVLEQNPRFSRMFSIIAEYAEWEHRYPELVELAREALAIDPEDAYARATLGLNLLRTGEETAGLRELRASWERDRYNVQVYNTLNLYDGPIARDYQSFSHPPFEFRLHRDERPVLEPYLAPLTTRAYGDLRKRYAFTPQGPLHIELYADSVQFSVRTTGLPSLGVQGVCFGKVVTGLSPKAGPVNWGQIVWHELSHVFHLQMSKGRVPRWFTEGLAEYETTIARPEWKREDDALLYDALREDRLPPLESMNRAFTRTRTPRDLMTAYYAAFSAVKYIVERFGIERVRAMLKLWGEQQPTAAVVSRALGVSLADLDRDFRAHTEERLGRMARDFQVDFAPFRDFAEAKAAAARTPADPEVQAALAMSAILHDDFVTAGAAAREAIRRAPKHRIANFALARVALEQNDAVLAEKCLRNILASGADGYSLRMLLVHASLARREVARARQELEAAIALDPDRPEAWQNLLEVAGKLNDEALALRAVAALAKLDQHDRALHAAHVALLAKSDAWTDVVPAAETAMYLDPGNAALHWHLGRAYFMTGKHGLALVELDRALALGHPEVGGIQLTRARALLALGKRPQARAAAEAAIHAEPGLRSESERVLRGEL